MKTNNYLLNIFTSVILLMSTNAYSVQYKYVSNPMEGVGSVLSSQFADNFYPTTHFKKGELFFSFTPSYFEVPVIRDEGNAPLEGDNFKGWSISSNFSYSLGERIALLAYVSHIEMDGTVILTNNNQRATSDNINNFYMAGLAVDIINDNLWSIPLYLCGTIRQYNTEGRITPPVATTYTPIADFQGSGWLKGYVIGAAISRKFDFGNYLKFKLTLYGLVGSEIEEAQVEGIYVTPNTGEKFTTNVGSGFFLPGLKVIYETNSPWEISISISGLFGNFTNIYNDLFLEGLEMKLFSLTLAYRM